MEGIDNNLANCECFTAKCGVLAKSSNFNNRKIIDDKLFKFYGMDPF